MSNKVPESPTWRGTDNPFVQTPEDPGIMRILIIIVAAATIGVAVFSLTHGIVALYQFYCSFCRS